jgi:hypothetical protein
LNTAGAVPIVRPYGGTEPRCPLCGNHGARMIASGLPILGDLLWRECTRCCHGWHERLPPPEAGQVRTGQHL